MTLKFCVVISEFLGKNICVIREVAYGQDMHIIVSQQTFIFEKRYTSFTYYRPRDHASLSLLSSKATILYSDSPLHCTEPMSENLRLGSQNCIVQNNVLYCIVLHCTAYVYCIVQNPLLGLHCKRQPGSDCQSITTEAGGKFLTSRNQWGEGKCSCVCLCQQPELG